MLVPQNRGLACVLNDLIAIAHVQGFDYLARMDADDVMLSSRLQKQMSYMESHKDIDVVGGAIEEMDKQSISRGKTIIYPLTHQECVNFFEKRNPLAHPAVLFRYSFFEKLKVHIVQIIKESRYDALVGWTDGRVQNG